jgi:hypothetical protein
MYPFCSFNSFICWIIATLFKTVNGGGSMFALGCCQFELQTHNLSTRKQLLAFKNSNINQFHFRSRVRYRLDETEILVFQFKFSFRSITS